MTDDDLPMAKEIIAMHEEIEEAYDLKYKGIRVAAPKLKLREGVLDPAMEYDSPWYQAAVLLFGIQSTHVFEDANKRTAWAVTIEYLNEQGLTVDLPQDDDIVERIVRRAGLFDIEELAEWLETGEIDESKLPER